MFLESLVLLAIQTSNRSCVRMCMRAVSAICSLSRANGRLGLRAGARLRNDGLSSSSLTGSSKVATKRPSIGKSVSSLLIAP